MASQITYRSMGPNFDPLWGQGQQNFLSDVDAVAQAIQTRLLLFQGEWWSDTSDGTPYWQKILGKAGNNTQAINLLLIQRILGTPFVTAVVNIESTFDSPNGKFSFTATVQTQFGTVAVTNIPTPPPQVLP